MNNTEEKRVKAYLAAHKAMVKELGESASHEDLFEVCVLLATHAVTGNKELSLADAQLNAAIFIKCLAASIDEMYQQKTRSFNA